MKLTHVDDEGRIKMVGVGHKPDTERVAVARGEVRMKSETLRLTADGQLRPCLLSDREIDLRTPLREGAGAGVIKALDRRGHQLQADATPSGGARAAGKAGHVGDWGVIAPEI